MASAKVIRETVARALDTAVDQHAPTEPRDERCHFDPTARSPRS